MGTTVAGCRLAALVAMLHGLAAPATTQAQDLDRLRQALEALRAENGVAAVGLVLVSADAVILADAWGVADRASGRRANADSRFRIGSITKTFTGLLALRLRARDGLALEQPVAATLGPLAPHNPWRETDPITLAQLLEHSAGLEDMGKAEFDHSDPSQPPLAETLARHATGRRVRWRPALHAEYSNAGYGLAGAVIEQRAGAAFETLMREHVLDPLGLEASGFRPAPAGAAPLLSGYDRDGRSTLPYWHTIYRPFGGLNTDLGDMSRLLRMLLQQGATPRGRFLAPAAVQRLTRPTTTLAARAGLEHGYGLGMYAWLRDGIVFRGHGGDADGYLSHYGVSPALGRGYFVVINAFRPSTLRAMRRHIERWLIGDHEPPAAPPPPQSGPDLRALAGEYVAVTWRFPWQRAQPRERLQVHALNGQLALRHDGGQRLTLVPVTERLFRYAKENRATAAFARGPAGRLYLQTPDGNYARLESP